MLASNLVPILIGMGVIVVLVVMLASTRRSLSGPDEKMDGKYPSGYWMTIGITGGVLLGLLLGLAVHTLPGGISIGLGLGLLVGKWLDNRYDKNTREYTDMEKQERLRRASWGLIVMVLLVLATLAAVLMPLLE